MTVTASTVVDAPPSAVFDILADPRQHPLIDGSGTVTGSVSGPDRLELGSRFGMDMKMGAPYKTRNTVVQYEKDRLIDWKHVAPQVWRYELATDPTGATRVTETWDITGYPGFARPMVNAIFGKKTQKGIEETLVKLKAAAEKGVSDS